MVSRACLALPLLLAAAMLSCTPPKATPAPAAVAATFEGMPSRLETHVRMLAETLVPRDSNHPETLERVAAYVEARFRETGAKVTTQPFTVEGRSYRNVIAHFGPEDGSLIVVGAHYDTCGERPGADDNGSGIAGLIELAGLLGKKSQGRSIDLVAYTLEEPPFFRTEHMGSAHHARSLKDAGRTVKAMIALEMIGYFSDTPHSQDYPLGLLKLFYPSQGDFIAVVGNLGSFGLTRMVKGAMRSATPLPVRSINAPRASPGLDFSDHLNYWKEGFPAVMVTDTAFYRNLAYHEAGDTPERLDYHRMAMVVKGVREVVAALGRNDD